MKSKLEWPFNLMEDVNKKITDERYKLPQCKEDASEDLLAIVAYMFTDIACRDVIAQCRLRGASAILCHYRDGMKIQEIANEIGVSRTRVDQNINTVLAMIARCDKYRKMLRYGMDEYLRLETQAAMQRGRNLGYREGVYDGKNDEATFNRGYTKGYNDGICGLQNRLNVVNRNTTIEELNFSIRTYNCLKRSGINTVDQLMGMSFDDLLTIRNMGRKSAEEVLKFVNQLRTVECQSADGEAKRRKVEKVAQQIVADLESDELTPEEIEDVKKRTHETAKRLYEAEKEALGLNNKED